MTPYEEVRSLLGIVHDWPKPSQNHYAFRLIESVALERVKECELHRDTPSSVVQLWCTVYMLAHSVHCADAPFINREWLRAQLRAALHALLDLYEAESQPNFG